MESIKQSCQVTLEIKKSFFYGFVVPVDDEQAALSVLEKIRETYPNANHVCYAYSVSEGQIIRFSDDGEPKHTAGMPMLGVLQKQGLTNVCAIVVREFGGIKLGASGLVRAYTKAVSDALKDAVRVTKQHFVRVGFNLSYPAFNKIEHGLDTLLEKIDLSYTDTVSVEGQLLEDALEDFQATLQEKAQQAIPFEVLERYSLFR